MLGNWDMGPPETVAGAAASVSSDSRKDSVYSKSSCSQSELARYSLLSKQAVAVALGSGGGNSSATTPNSQHFSHSVILNTFNTPQYNKGPLDASGFLPSKLDTDIGSATGRLHAQSSFLYLATSHGTDRSRDEISTQLFSAIVHMTCGLFLVSI